MNQDVEKMIAEWTFLSQIIVESETQAIDMTVADVRDLGVKIQIGNLRCSINMPFVIALEWCVQPIRINKKDYSCEGNKNI